MFQEEGAAPSIGEEALGALRFPPNKSSHVRASTPVCLFSQVLGSDSRDAETSND